VTLHGVESVIPLQTLCQRWVYSASVTAKGWIRPVFCRTDSGTGRYAGTDRESWAM